MARICGRPIVELKIALEMNEEEARALECIMSYDIESFLKIFYFNMGKAYLEKHEKGLRSLFETSRQPLSIWLSKADKSKELFNEK